MSGRCRGWATSGGHLTVSSSSFRLSRFKVYALYQKSRRVRLFLTCCCLAEVTVMAIFIGMTLADNRVRLPVISTNTGCYYTGIFSISAVFWLPALVYEPVLCLMVLWKAGDENWLDRFWRQRTSTVNKDFNSGKLVKVFARDSLIYFVGVFIELVINTVIWWHYNWYINVVVVPWSGALPSVLGSRLFLRMREAILFPERYSSDLGGESREAQSGVRLA
ncbi:hypothetical protein LXA43DRAFT_1059660 [Ganoderma leucocontextum]|nr:hypothetical protein LXA43DRAFT_1059660 [Ganoderma leucocontextum]